MIHRYLWVLAVLALMTFTHPTDALAQTAPSWKALPAACLPHRAQLWQDGVAEPNQASCHCPPSSMCPSSVTDYLTVLGAYQAGMDADNRVVNAAALSVTKLPPVLFARCCPTPLCPAGTLMAGNPVPINGDCNCAAGQIFTTSTTTTTSTIPTSTTDPNYTAEYSYVQTCQNIVINNNRLTANCLDTTGVPRPDAVDNVGQCTSIHNSNGTLVCNRSGGIIGNPFGGGTRSLTVLEDSRACGCPIGQSPTVVSITNPADVRIRRRDGSLASIPSGMTSYSVCAESSVWTPTTGGDGGGAGDSSGGDSGGDGGGDCLSGDAQLVRADGSRVSIATIAAGDEIEGIDGTVKVKTLTRIEQSRAPLFYRINDLPFLITGEHPIETKDGWKVVDPEVKPDGKYTAKLHVGDVLVGKDTNLEVKSITLVPHDAAKGAYNLATEGDKPVSVGGVSVKPFNAIDIQY